MLIMRCHYKAVKFAGPVGSRRVVACASGQSGFLPLAVVGTAPGQPDIILGFSLN